MRSLKGNHFLNKESGLTNRIRLHLQDKFNGIILWRNSIGFDERTKVYYGIGGKGGSDLLGIYKGRFVALEVKVPGGRRSDEQINFIRMTKESGGLAGFVESEQQAEAVINGD